MRAWLCFGVMVVLSACSEERPPPPVVAPKVLPRDAGPADAGVTPVQVIDAGQVEDTEPGLPDDPPLRTDVSLEGEALTQLLLRDPEAAQRALGELPMPTVWQLSIVSQLALKHGERVGTVVPEKPLPEVPLEHGGEVESGPAFVGATAVLLKAPGKPKAAPLASLPIGTAVEVTRLDGELAFVTVELATDVTFSTNSVEPTRVLSVRKTGVVEKQWLTAQRPSASELWAKADASVGSDSAADTALVWADRAFALERSETAREHYLRVAQRAHRASWVVRAATAPTMTVPRRLAIAWACRGAPEKAKWLSFASGKLPPKLPTDLCLAGVDLRKPCEAQLKALAAWRKRTDVLEAASLTAAPVAVFTVDATRPRRLFFYSMTVRQHESCSPTPDFELDPYSTRVRHLNLPVGTAQTTVRLELQGYEGKEFGLISAHSEVKAREWLRRRGAHRWTLDNSGELSVSLGVADLGYQAEHDVNTATHAIPPEFDCISCQ